MHHASMTTGAGALVWVALLLFCLTVFCSAESTSKIQDDSASQMDSVSGADVKREWDKPLRMWGKRAWQNLQGGWGKRESGPWGHQFYPNSADKRAWQNLQGGWGKRWSPEEEWILQQLLDEEESEYAPNTESEPYNNDEKRSWKALNGGWGKRSEGKWGSFRGSWGKRDPAWNNLKGIWGKRSYPEWASQ